MSGEIRLARSFRVGGGRRIGVIYREDHNGNPLLLGSLEEIDQMFNDLVWRAPESNLFFSLYSLERPLLPSGDLDHQVRVGVRGDLDIGLIWYSDKGGPGSPFFAMRSLARLWHRRVLMALLRIL